MHQHPGAPKLRLYTISAIHEGVPRSRRSPPGLFDLGPALAGLGVKTGAPPPVKGRRELVEVLIDVAALAAALARLSQAEVLRWLERLDTAARQSREVSDIGLQGRGPGNGGPAGAGGDREL